MFKKVKCNHCENRYDETFNECPNCHAPNEQLDKSFKRIQMIPFGKQIALFATGSFGFSVLGVIISLIISLFDTQGVSNVLLNMILNAVVYLILFVILFAIV